jgi:glycosyltransferase involved in cell wall biosynthesis
MKISVVIPTYIRPKYLLQTVREVIRQSHHAVCEIIIIDQTPKELKTAEFENQISNLKQQANIIYNYRETANLPAARNAAIAIAKGEIVLMLDDDVLLPKNFIEEHYSCYTQNKNVVCVVGLPYHREAKHLEQIDDITVSNFQNYTTPHFNQTQRDDNWKGLLVGANHSVLKDYAINAGGYDETMLGNAYYEDSDFVIRLRKTLSDKVIVYNPKAFLVHLRAPMGGARVTDMKKRPAWLSTFSTHIYMWRHTGSTMRRELFVRTLRMGPLRRDNIIQFWKQPHAWYGFVKSLLISYGKKQGPQSIFINKK